jgi:hypothetical protein
MLTAKRCSRTLFGSTIRKNGVFDFKRNIAIINLNEAR